MNKIVISIIATFFVTSALALTTANPVPFPPKKPVEATTAKPAAKAYTGTWLPPKEIQNKVKK
jgi:hypothetical protein